MPSRDSSFPAELWLPQVSVTKRKGGVTTELTANGVVLKAGGQSRPDEVLVLPSAIGIVSARLARSESSQAKTHAVDAAPEARAKRDDWGSATTSSRCDVVEVVMSKQKTR